MPEYHDAAAPWFPSPFCNPSNPFSCCLEFSRDNNAQFHRIHVQPRLSRASFSACHARACARPCLRPCMANSAMFGRANGFHPTLQLARSAPFHPLVAAVSIVRKGLGQLLTPTFTLYGHFLTRNFCQKLGTKCCAVNGPCGDPRGRYMYICTRVACASCFPYSNRRCSSVPDVRHERIKNIMWYWWIF